MKKVAFGLIAAGFLALSGTAWAVDNGSGGGANSAHNATEAKGTCSKCHIPHGGRGDKIWAVDLTARTDFTGVHQLCNSCHYGTGGAYTATSGLASVYTLNAFQNHSMLHWANTAAAGITIPAGFVLNTSDTDTIWAVADPDDGSTNGAGDGFYCGTCHNPHKQPVLGGATTEDGNGDYLRVDGAQTVAQFGASGVRVGACTQCHTTVFTAGAATGHQGNCMLCHHPHQGQTVATDATNNRIAEKILVIPLAGNDFVAEPNVPAFTAGYPAQIAAICYGCHKAGGAGAAALIDPALEHHQMSSQAGLGASSHAPGTLAADNYGGEFTCTNCHDMHNGTQDFYLKSAANGGGTYTGTATDDSTFCTSRCHNNKAYANLGDADGDAHRATMAGSPDGRGGCFMCHFIHDGAARGTAARADITAQMRIEPVNLAAAGTNADADVADYEDMCFGCHSSATLARGTGLAGSTLQVGSAGAYFTHRFTGTPSAGVLTNMTAAGLPVAAASNLLGGQYGAVVGDLYCGSCHNVHQQNLVDREGQLFRANHNTAATSIALLCSACHGNNPMAGRTHPTYLDAGYDTNLPSARTSPNVPQSFGTGGDGLPGGRTGAFNVGGTGDATGNMSCETCHNFHTADTDLWGAQTDDGTVGDHGKLLVMDNLSTTTGSDMCRSCHGTSY